MRRISKFFLVLIIVSFNYCDCFSQAAPPYITDTLGNRVVVKASGPQFNASGWKQIWWGKRWRREWLQPAQFPVLNLDTTHGGLTPLKKGGGFQTKSLRLLSKTGKEYVLRTIDKDLDLIVPPEFKGTVVNDILEDQLSFSHPYGALVTSKMTAAIGSLHTNPVIVFVPDNAALGEFRTDFANKLCLFEERPSGDGWEKSSLTNYASDIVNSEKLFQKLQADNDRQVDQSAFLKIRLFDMIINDWDRHPDQWIWAGSKKQGKTIYQPFARDRDQALSKPDGVFLTYLTLPWMLRKFRNLKPRVNDIIGVNLSAVSLDKRFLNELNKQQWKEIVAQLQQSLSDSVIKKSLQQMPAEVYNFSGNQLLQTLSSRRDNMSAVAMKYYRIINRQILLNGTEDAELFVIDKKGHKNTTVTILKQSPGKRNGDTLYHRVFNKRVTKEINIYGMGGNDQFIFKGRKKNTISLRTIAGGGNDKFVDAAIIKGSGQPSRIYDQDSAAIKLSSHYKIKNTADTSYTNYKPREFKYNWWKVILAPGFNPDDGVLLKTGFSYRKYAWHKNPFSWEQTLTADIASNTGAVGINYKAIFANAIGKGAIELLADLKGPRYVLNFYGYGNSTKLNGKTNPYFRVRSSGFLIQPSLTYTLGRGKLHTGISFQSVKIQPVADRFIAEPGSGIDSSVYKTKYFAGINIGYTASYFNDTQKIHRGGMSYTLQAAYIKNVQVLDKDFLKMGSAIKFVLPICNRLSLAHRTGAETNIGEFEFYQANTIGGLDKLRGYWRTRFAGNSSFYQNTELRWDISHLNGYLFRGKFGCLAFCDDGKVWTKKGNNSSLHTGYGAGIYFIPFNLVPLNFTYGISKEANVFTFKSGFFF